MRFCEINDIASVASELAGGLRARGHEVTVIRPRLFGGGLPWMVKPVVGPVRAVEWAMMLRTVERGDFDMVHIHYAYLGMLGVLGRFPYILHCHGSDVREMNPFTRPMVERALAAADRVFYATPDLARYVRSRRPDALFLPNPVDATQFRPLAPVEASARVFICCSLTEIKGAARIVQACRMLAKERPDIQVTAYDGGEFAPAMGALPNVTLIQPQPRAALPGIIGRHGLVVGQVLLGALGMAELEAMACGRPVIAWSRFGSFYGESPPVVRALDGRDVATAIARLIDDPPLRARLGAESRSWVDTYHRLDSAGIAVETAALDILAQRTGRPLAAAG